MHYVVSGYVTPWQGQTQKPGKLHPPSLGTWQRTQLGTVESSTLGTLSTPSWEVWLWPQDFIWSQEGKENEGQN